VVFKKLTIAAACSTALLTGCSGVPKYEDATGPETAKLRLRMAEPVVSNLFLISVDMSQCKQDAYFSWVSGGRDDLYTKRVNMIDSPPPGEGALEFVIPAGKPLAARTAMHFGKLSAGEVLFAMAPGVNQSIRDKQPGLCPAPGLMPKAGEQYEMIFKAMPGSCSTAIYRLSEENGRVERQDITNDFGTSVITTGVGEFHCGKS
jgi:hypothetical protein